ncbi:FixH family protein [Chengkuizengella axinellae]|uniref:FixH family protein n=1 Tax=Chengkuizengella axinellae TaxID=3064388 RepID=A0ABT9J1W0_9BACL|nr:FixH family protein [Chengkuizengella sp. 2205SS18-9]MDP5275596.1 FixH family protein [Chengkuizengella sp. 2205SS18-9]
MKSLLSSILVLTLMLSGCTTENSESAEYEGKHDSMDQPMEESLHPLEVQVVMSPETIEAGNEVTIQAIVSQNQEAVTDASEVRFEIGMIGNEETEMIEGHHQGDGVYSIQKTFNHEAAYFVIAHVTARDMHNMPKIKFNVGEVEISDSQETESTESHEMNESDDHSTLE